MMTHPVIRTGKTTTIRRITIGETGASRHHGDLIEELPETAQTSQHDDIEALKGTLNWTLFLPRDKSLRQPK